MTEGTTTTPLSEWVGTDPLEKIVAVNALGFFEDYYGASTPAAGSDAPVISDFAIQCAKASGIAATNVTVASGTEFQEAMDRITAFDRVVDEHPDDVVKVLSVADIRRAKAEGKAGIIFGFQNAAMVEDDASNIDRFADRGVTIIQLTYNAPTQLGGGSLAPGDPGLTDFGREVIERLNDRRVIVDLSHSGRQMCLDSVAASAADQPVCITHTGCQSVANVPRNKSDEELRAVAERGGFVGIYFMPFIAPGRAFDSSDVIEHIDRAISLCGEDQVGIGTDHGIVNLGDMDTVKANYRAKVLERQAQGISAPGEDPDLLPYAADLTGPDQFRVLAEAMAAHGYGSSRIEKILGGNFLRYAERIWGR